MGGAQSCGESMCSGWENGEWRCDSPMNPHSAAFGYKASSESEIGDSTSPMSALLPAVVACVCAAVAIAVVAIAARRYHSKKEESVNRVIPMVGIQVKPAAAVTAEESSEAAHPQSPGALIFARPGAEWVLETVRTG